MEQFQPPQFDQEPGRWSGWGSPLIWSVFLTVAFLAFEFTAQPAISVVVLCCKFGWNDAVTGWWLRRTDPWVGRGRACFWFCLASAATKVILVAFGLMMLFATALKAVEGPQQQGPGRRQELPPGFMAAAGTMLAGLPLVTILSVLGCRAARKHRVQVWVDSTLTASRRARTWPPQVAGASNFASLARLLMISVLCVCLPLVSVLAGTATFAALLPVGLPGMAASFAAFSAGFLTAVLFAWWLVRLCKGVIAAIPQHCWDPRLEQRHLAEVADRS
ncbi:MAG: hypothetical protein ACKV0T_29690 [Planctomycetales bacterium]